MSNTDNNIPEEIHDFGKMLSQARKAQNYSINDIFENIKIPEDVLTAIEACDLEALPSPAFAQGYIRSYAKFLEIPEDDVLKLYYQSLPGKNTSDFRTKTEVTEKAGNQIPLKNIVTVLLIVAVVAAFFYGGFQYYQKKADIVGNEREPIEDSFTGSSADTPGSQVIEIEQKARLTDDGELVLGKSALTAESGSEDLDTDEIANDTSVLDTEEDSITSIEETEDTARQASSRLETQEPVMEEIDSAPVKATPAKLDNITFYTLDGTWLEVRDANNEQLFYNMLPADSRRTLTGEAPFKVFMGNATTSSVKINDIEVDYSVRIRANRTVRFKVSSEDQKVLFHK